MKNNLLYIYALASFAILVCAPGRLAFGIVLVLELNFLLLLLILFKSLVRILSLENISTMLVLVMLMCCTVLFKQLLSLFSPIMALQLNFVLYLVPFSVFVLENIFTESNKMLSLELKERFTQSLFFSLGMIFFFLLRDILGFGTITLPVKNGLFEKVLFQVDNFSIFSFFASIPGAIVLVTLIFLGFASVMHKISKENNNVSE